MSENEKADRYPMRARMKNVHLRPFPIIKAAKSDINEIKNRVFA